MVSVAVIKHSGQKKLGEERLYLAYMCTIQSIVEGSQENNSGRNVEAGSEAEATEECFFLAGFPWFGQLAFLDNLEWPARGGTPHSGWALPHESLIKKISHRHAHRPV